MWNFICITFLENSLFAQNPFIMFLSEAIRCNQDFAEWRFITGLTGCRQSHDLLLFFILGSLDPSGLLDIASLRPICSCVFSVVNVRQEWGRTRKSPSATWDMNKDSTFAQTFSLLPCSARGPATLNCRHFRSVFSHCTPSCGDWLTTLPQRWMSLWTACGIWVNCSYITGSKPVGDSLNGNYGGICFITEHIHRSDFSVYITFLLCDQQEYINDVSWEIHVLILNYFLSSRHLSLTFTVSPPPLSFQRGFYE